MERELIKIEIGPTKITLHFKDGTFEEIDVPGTKGAQSTDFWYSTEWEGNRWQTKDPNQNTPVEMPPICLN